jgi:rubredoxin
MPWRRKPASWLRYWDGPVNRSTEFTMVIVYCVGPERGGPVCGHNSMLKFADLPDWNWQDISAHLKCTKCGAIGYVDTRLNWSEVIDFNRPDGRLVKR